MIASFDIFDTCLARRVAIPTDLFWEMAPGCAAIRGEEATHHFSQEFVWARVRGEQLARKRVSADDIGLNAIWEEVVQLLDWECHEGFVEVELEVERRNLYPIGATLELVDEARRKGQRVVFVSDTYLPRSFLQGLLQQHGFLRPGDGLYLSGEVGRTKSSGNLFPHVLAEEGRPARELHHTGDHPDSDAARPREIGADATLLTHHHLTRVERRLVATEAVPDVQDLWAGAMRMSRIHRDAHLLGGNLAVVSQFIGPFLLGFASWVLDQARRQGTERLYFASRDCQLACQVAKILAPTMGGVDCRYLYISRQSLLLPTVRNVSRDHLPWLRRGYERHDLGGVLAKLELKFDETEEVWQGLDGGRPVGPGFRLEGDEAWDRFWERLEASELTAMVHARAERRRAASLEYFEAQGLLEATPSALVDLGWSLTSQQALNQLLRAEGGRESPLGGFYLQHIHQRPGSRATGPVRALFPPVPMDRRQALQPIFPHEYANILEHTIGLADHKSVHHYERNLEGGAEVEEVVPFGPHHPLERTTGGLIQEVREGALAFASAHQELAMRPDSRDTQATRRRLGLLLEEVLQSPSREIVEELGSIRCSQDQNHRFHSPLARPLTVRDALPEGLPLRRNPQPAWKEGSLVLTGAGTRAAIRAAAVLREGLPSGLKKGMKALLGRAKRRTVRPIP